MGRSKGEKPASSRRFVRQKESITGLLSKSFRAQQGQPLMGARHSQGMIFTILSCGFMPRRLYNPLKQN